MNLDSPVRIGVYALGFAAGNYVGSLVEERMAVGFATVQIISLTCPPEPFEEIGEKLLHQKIKAYPCCFNICFLA